ncbi:MAG: hypothetical protein AAGF12_21360 [Myxococcota bacterium]
MLVYRVAQLLLASAILILILRRSRALLFEAPVDTNPFLKALRARLEAGDRSGAQALASAGKPAFVPQVVDEALQDRVAGEERLVDLRLEALRGLWVLKVLGRIGTATGILGAIVELVWMLEGDHGLLPLKAGAVESIALNDGMQSVVLGVGSAIVAFIALGMLRRAATRLIQDMNRAFKVVEAFSGRSEAER